MGSASLAGSTRVSTQLASILSAGSWSAASVNSASVTRRLAMAAATVNGMLNFAAFAVSGAILGAPVASNPHWAAPIVLVATVTRFTSAAVTPCVSTRRSAVAIAWCVYLQVG